MQLVGRQAGQMQRAGEGRRPGGAGGPPPPMGKSTESKSPLPVSGPETPRKKGELCPLEAMLRGIGEPESWLMDCSSPAAAWELPPPLEEDAGGELGLLEGAVTECAEPSPGASSLGSWAASVSGPTPLSPPPKPRWDGGAQKGAQKEMSPSTEIH